MTSCRECRQENPDDANFCHQCGNALVAATAEAAGTTESSPPPPVQRDEAIWRQFIGPNADRYLAQFKRFSANGQTRFAFSWNWPAFLFIPFLWFLYRKMYVHAFVYAIGPTVSTYLTGDFLSGLVWSVMAGATGNYLYYCHCKEQLAGIKKVGWSDQVPSDAALKEAGGVQPYVIWVGVAIYVIFFATLVKMIQEGPPDFDKLPGKPAKQAMRKTV